MTTDVKLPEQFSHLDELPVDKWISVLTRLKAKYYTGEPEVSDAVYDQLEDAFRERFPDYVSHLPVGTVVDELEKVELPTEVGSLPKVNEDEFDDWEPSEPGEYLYQWKLDGGAVVLQYENGELELAATRGDGEVGESIFHVVRELDSVPNILPSEIDCVLKAEAVLRKEDHPNAARRNLAVGSLKQMDPKKALERNLEIVIHSVLKWSNFHTFQRPFQELEEQGFEVLHPELSRDSLEDIPWDHDGVVVKVVAQPAEVVDAVAVKSEEETKYTTCRAMELNVGKSNKVTPVLKVEPTVIDNREITSISLGSMGIAKELNLGPGDTVEIAFSNEIIPQVKSVVEREKENGRFDLNQCHSCDTDLVWTENNQEAFCPNDDCYGKTKSEFKSRVSRLDVDGLGDEKIEELRDLFNSDFYLFVQECYSNSEFLVDQLIKFEGWGEKTASSIVNQVKDFVENMTTKDLMYVLSLDSLGPKTIEKILKKVHEVDFWSPIQAFQSVGFISKIDGLGEKTARKIAKEVEENNELIKNMILLKDEEMSLGVTLDNERTSKLEDVKVHVTGSLENFSSRSEFKDFIKEHGGEWSKASDSILVANDQNSGSNKLQNAREKDIEILTEDEFISRFGLDGELE